MRVLFLGHCNHRYLKYLNNILKSEHNAATGVIDLFQFVPNEEEKKAYDYIANSKTYKPPSLTKRQLVGLAIKGLFRSKFSEVLKATLSLKLKPFAIKFISDFIEKDKKQYYQNLIDEFNPTIIQLHYINTVTLQWLSYIPENCKLIVTFWGSDLMDTDGGLDEYKLQLKAVKRANRITTQTVDTRTILISKYGQNLLDKISCVTFNPLEEKRDLLDRLDNDSQRNAFKEKYQIQDKIPVLVGYSAAKGQNHIETLKTINQLDKSTKDKIVCLIPLTYNGSSEYVGQVLAELKNINVKTIALTTFMSNEEMMELVAYSDIFIAVRTSDALNATMVESLYAKNIVVAGSWLPYNIYHRLGCYFETVDTILSLESKLNYIIQNIDKLKEKAALNKPKIDDLYANEKVSKAWTEIYKFNN